MDGKFHCELLITPEHEPYIFDVHRRMSGFFNPWANWDVSGEITWEDWIVRAECGMDLSDFPVGFRQRKHIHCRNIFAPRDGILKRVVFDEYLSSHIFPHYDGRNLTLHNIYVTDHLHMPIVESYPAAPSKSPLQFAFDSAEEADRICNPESDEFYSHIRFEYADAYNDI